MIFYLQASIEAVKGNNSEKQVVIIDNFGEKLTLKSEEILVAMGRSPNIDGLGLDAIQVAFQRTGITVDNRLRTSQKHIFAAGDVNGGFQFTHAAGYEGGIVVSNAIFHLPRKTDYTYLPWCTYTDPELASIGMNEKTANQRGSNTPYGPKNSRTMTGAWLRKNNRQGQDDSGCRGKTHRRADTGTAGR